MMTNWIVFDYDGTLTTHRSGWTLLHALFGTEHVQNKRVEAYRRGDLTFERWADRDVQDWIERGATSSDINAAAQAVKLSEGTSEVLSALQERGHRFGVLSGGLTELTKKIHQFDPEFVSANSLSFDESGHLTGVKKEVSPSGKDTVLSNLGEKHGFTMEDVTFVGDNESDIEALAAAGRAILFDPAPTLDENEYTVADIVIEEHDLTKLLNYF